MLKRFKRIFSRINTLSERLTRVQEALGRIEVRQTAQFRSPSAAEFRVFSQWGEDGIIQHLIQRVPIERRVFVEFGVENYVESNTRFLLTNNHWSGLVMDGSQANIDYIKHDDIYWSCNLKAECAFIDRDNINQLLKSNGMVGDIGLLSVDIDGNDYWVWEAIDTVSPRIVICEYSSQFGPDAEVTTPYSPTFVRDLAHHSRIYYGASISALTSLASRKGYSLVAGNQAGNNIFFVRNDVIGDLQVRTPQDVYRRSQFREYHDTQGQLTFDDFETRLSKISELMLHDLRTGKQGKIRDLIRVDDLAHR
jgi:hypothetical protein